MADEGAIFVGSSVISGTSSSVLQVTGIDSLWTSTDFTAIEIWVHWWLYSSSYTPGYNLKVTFDSAQSDTMNGYTFYLEGSNSNSSSLSSNPLQIEGTRTQTSQYTTYDKMNAIRILTSPVQPAHTTSGQPNDRLWLIEEHTVADTSYGGTGWTQCEQVSNGADIEQVRIENPYGQFGTHSGIWVYGWERQ